MKESLQHWQASLRKATTAEGVLAEVGRYLMSISEDEIGCLPDSARPVRLDTTEDLMAYNLQVARDELMWNGDARTVVLLREMATILNEAASRIANMSMDFPTRP